MRIGYYAHHHGSGHCRQADKLAALLPVTSRQQFIVFTSLATDAYTFVTVADEQIIRLSPEDERPDDVLTGRAGQYWQPECLHYSPVGNSAIQKRSLQILTGIEQHNIDLMIIDVSVEVAMLCRVASVPYLYVRLAGLRDDAPHLNAFAGALGLIAPYPETLEAEMTPIWLRRKTLYLDFLPEKTAEPVAYVDFIQLLIPLAQDPQISKRLTDLMSEAAKVQQPIITVIKGYGGHGAIDAKLPELRAMYPKAFIISLGPIADDKRHYTDISTHVTDVAPFIAHSDCLVMACGLNGIAQVYQHTTPLVVLPDERPHQEQVVMAESLIAQGRALSWQQFVDHLKSAQTIDNSLKSLAKDSLEHHHDETSLNGLATLFMSSLDNYDTTKLWFDKWLLPRLKLTLER